MDISEICSLALMRIGSKTGIADVTTEQSKEGKLCRIIYPLAVDTVLREFPWNFATRRVSLAQVSGATCTNWEYVYAYPTDCLRIDSIVVEGSRMPTIGYKVQYEVGFDGTQKVIFCDSDSVEIIYRSRVEDFQVWDPCAVSALAWYIASELAMPLASKPDVSALCRNGYLATIHAAAAMSLNERQDGPDPDGEINTTRFS